MEPDMVSHFYNKSHGFQTVSALSIHSEEQYDGVLHTSYCYKNSYFSIINKTTRTEILPRINHGEGGDGDHEVRESGAEGKGAGGKGGTGSEGVID